MNADWASVSRREGEILEAVRERLTNAEIAARFFISERTVESHVSSLLRKLGARDRNELAALAAPAKADDAAPRLPGPAQILAAGPLIGRQEPLSRLATLWEKSAAGQSCLALLTGEAGVGKSRLAADFASRVHATGARVIWGSCLEDMEAPYQPFADALEDHAELLASGVPAAEIGDGANLLASTLGFQRSSGDASARTSADPLPAAAAFWLALRRYLRWLASKRPLLFVMEDLHWASESTREAVLQLVRHADPIALLVLVTARDTHPDVDRGGDVFLGRCELLPNSDRVQLRGLSADGVAELLTALGSSADADRVCAETGGIPLLTREVARSAAAPGSTLAALLAPRYRRLSDEASTAIDAAAVLGATFDAVQVARVLDKPVMDVLAALDDAEAAGLVVPMPDRPGRFTFVHPLFRTIHYGNLATRARLELHHRAAIELEQAAVDDRMIAALARHACIAAPIGDPRAAVRFACKAAAVAERAFALDEAAHHYRQALTVAELVPDDRRLRLALTIDLGRVVFASGDNSGRHVLTEAAGWAREVGDGASLADIAWAMAPFGRPPSPGRSDVEFVSIAEDALRLLHEDASPSRVRVLAALSTQATTGGNPELGCECATEAVRLAREIGDPITLGVALLAERIAGGLPPRPEPRSRIADELIELGHRLREPSFTVNGLYTRVWALRELGELRKHDRAIEEYASAVAEHPAPTFAVYLTVYRATQSFLRGDLDEAARLVTEATEASPDHGLDPHSVAGPMQALVLHARGQLGLLAPAIAHRIQDFAGFGGFSEALLALSYAHAGQTEAAGRLVATAAASDFAFKRNMTYTTALALFAEAVEITGGRDAANRLIELLAPFSGLVADNTSCVFESVDLAIAKASLAAGDVERARLSAERVLASEIGQFAPIVRARALVRLSAAAAAGAEVASPVDALVDEALAIAGNAGATIVDHDAALYGLT